MIKRLTAPNQRIKNRRLHSDYVDRFPKDFNNRLNRVDFEKALEVFNYKLIDAIIFDNFKFNIIGLGSLGMVKSKITTFYKGKLNKHLSIDWGETQKQNKVIYHMNEHTDGYRFSIRLKKINFKNSFYYKFKPARSLNKYLSEILRNPDVYGKVDAYLTK